MTAYASIMPACPRCGTPMRGGAPHGPWPVQYECPRCGYIRTSLARLIGYAYIIRMKF